LQKFESCSKDGLIFVQPDIPEKNLNDILTLGGNFSISEKLFGPIEAACELYRCSLDMKTCEKFLNVKVRQICQKFQNSSTIIGKGVANVTPPIKCPMEAGNYTLKKTDADLKRISFLPFDGFILNMVVKIITSVPARKARVVASCIKMEVKVEKIRSRT
jgi:hypothetical protein